MDDYKGINASTVSLSNNRISKFPTELFAAGSPIGTIDLSGNEMTSIPENSLKPKNGDFALFDKYGRQLQLFLQVPDTAAEQ